MAISFGDFVSIMFSEPLALLIVVLNMGVILVNGWTDAPNAIATCVSTRALSPRKSILMATVFNFLGVTVMTLFNASVATTVYKMVDFSGNTHDALLALCAAMFAIVVWAVAAWAFGIPTSESHALIAGISGAAIAMQGGLQGINGEEWIKVIYGLVLSVGMGFGLGWFNSRIINRIFRRMDYRKAGSVFGKAQIAAAAGMAFMHGAQDGQKFMGILLLGIMLSQGQSDTANLVFPLWMMISCSLLMALGTSIGGMKIIKSVGMKMVHLNKQQGFAADLAGVISLFVASSFGLPVSTTHTKTTAIMGVGAEKRISAVNWGVVREMLLAWVLTFPGCGLIGYLMVKLFMAIF